MPLPALFLPSTALLAPSTHVQVPPPWSLETSVLVVERRASEGPKTIVVGAHRVDVSNPPPLAAIIARPAVFRAPSPSMAQETLEATQGLTRFDERMSGEQVKASVYGAAGDLNDDRISPEEMAAIVAEAAPRLDDEQARSLETLLRMK